MPAAVQEAYKQLGADPLSDMAAVRRHCRQLMREYHPDHTDTQVLTKGYRDFANQRLRQISDALACIKTYFAGKG